jgi:uncharacterized protein
MTGALTETEIDALLHGEFVARIGCHYDETTYVIPVAYAYDGAALFGYSADGLKLEMMRHNPHVCVEVDRVSAPDDWVSVVAWGTFEPLDGADAQLALERLSSRLRAAAADTPRSATGGRSYVSRSGRYGLAWRIRLRRRTGRFERSTDR